MWMQHWGLTRDPFAELGLPYVALPTHDEAVARLTYAIETCQRWVFVSAAEGLGKTTVLRRALAETRGPRRRCAVVSCPQDGVLLFALFAERLGARVAREPSRLGAWSALQRAIHARSLEGFRLTLVIEDCDSRLPDEARRDLESLVRLAPNMDVELTFIQVERTELEEERVPVDCWDIAIRLEPLTASQVEQYLVMKLGEAGSRERIFTPRSITRLQSLSLGSPRVLERLATLSLMAGAVRGLEVITPELVDGVAQECWSTRRGATFNA